MRGFIFILCIILYAGLGTFIAGILFPNEDDVWVIGIFWPFNINASRSYMGYSYM